MMLVCVDLRADIFDDPLSSEIVWTMFNMLPCLDCNICLTLLFKKVCSPSMDGSVFLFPLSFFGDIACHCPSPICEIVLSHSGVGNASGSSSDISE